MGALFNNIKAVGDQLFNHNMDETKAPAGTLATGNYGGQAPSLAGAQAQYATPSTSASQGEMVTGGQPGTLHGMFNGLNNMGMASGGTNYFAVPTPTTPLGSTPVSATPAAPASLGSAFTAGPQSYVQAAGRTMAQQPGTGQAGTDLNNRGGYY